MTQYELYVIDCETTGLDSRVNDLIELSLIRLNTGEQKTWCLKPLNPEAIETAALRINGHDLHDLRHETKAGRETYLDPNKIVVEVENWIAEDGLPSDARILVGHNVHYDKDFLEQLWKKCATWELFPFSHKRCLDTMAIEFFMDLCREQMAEGYSLANLVKKYGIKNLKSHTAASDTLATKDVFEKQIKIYKNYLK